MPDKIIRISGPLASGKSRLARLIAEPGHCETVTLEHLMLDKFCMGGLMQNSPETIIIEECGMTEDENNYLKQLAASESVTCHNRGMLATRTPRPKVIVCVASRSTQDMVPGSRWFADIRLARWG